MHHQTSHGTPELRCAHWIQTETGSSRSSQGQLAAGGWQLAAGGVRNTKDRDAPALEVRAGMPGVGCTSRDTAGLSSTNRNRVKVARTSRRTVRDPSVLRQRLRFGHCDSDSPKRHNKPPGKAAREQKPGKTSSQRAHPHPPSQGTRRLYSNRVD